MAKKSFRQEVEGRISVWVTILVGITFGIFAFKNTLRLMSFLCIYLVVLIPFLIGIVSRLAQLMAVMWISKENSEVVGLALTGIVGAILFVAVPLLFFFSQIEPILILLLYWALGYCVFTVASETLKIAVEHFCKKKEN